MKTDSDHYFHLMMGFDAALSHLREVLEDHKDCPGCDLCIDCGGIEYTLSIHADLVACEAPWEAVRRFREETNPDDIKRAVERPGNATAAADAPHVLAAAKPAPPVHAAEQSAATSRPYWLG